MLQGADDPVSSPQDVETLRHALEPNYVGANKEQRLKVGVIPGVTHQWAQPPAALKKVRANVAEWLNRFG